MNIKIVRMQETDQATFGQLFIDEKFSCYTLEHLYKDNKNALSCIPTGIYGGVLRYNHNDAWRIEFTETGPRTHIQIHIGNAAKDTKGCILVGDKFDIKNNRLINSASAYARLKASFYGTINPNSTPNYNITIAIEYNLEADLNKLPSLNLDLKP